MRFLTEYAQYTAPVNNHELFYHFQGVTRDGAYYIIAIFPITVPVLAETSDAAAALPPGGIAYPDITDPNADWAWLLHRRHRPVECHLPRCIYPFDQPTGFADPVDADCPLMRSSTATREPA